MRRAVAIISLGASIACAPQQEGVFEMDGFATLIVGAHGQSGFAPVLVDLTKGPPDLVYAWAENVETQLAYWPQTIEELRVVDPVEAVTSATCIANQLSIASAAMIRCHDGDGQLVSCESEPGPLDAVVTEGWKGQHDPCDETDFLQLMSRTDFDIQTTTASHRGTTINANGAGFIAVPMGDGRVVLGQLSGADEEPFDRNTELAVVDGRLLGDADARVLVRTRSGRYWSAGAPRNAGEVWIGAAGGTLAAFDTDTGTITVVATSPLRLGTINDMATDPGDTERVFMTTNFCGVYVRERDASEWTEIMPFIDGITEAAPGQVSRGCGGHVTVTPLHEALIVGVAAELQGRPNLTNQRDDRDLLIRVSGNQVTVEDPWPPKYATTERWRRRLHAVATYQDVDGRLVEAIVGAYYQRPPMNEDPPYDFGEGDSLVFTRRPGEDARWEVRNAIRNEETVKGERVKVPPPIFTDAFGVSMDAPAWPHFSGLLSGTTLLLFGFDDLRMRRNASQPFIASVDPNGAALSWVAAPGNFATPSRIRPDGIGGVIVATGNINDARVGFEKRFHWWRPRP